MPVVVGAGYGPFPMSGVPVAGTDEVQTFTISASSGTFKLGYEGFFTQSITWSATNATLISNIDTALEALPTIGTGGVAVASGAGAMTAGVGTGTITFSGAALAKTAVATISVTASTLTGAGATVSIAKTTTGVNASFKGARPGAVAINTVTGIHYAQTNTAGGGAVTWTVIGSQS